MKNRSHTWLALDKNIPYCEDAKISFKLIYKSFEVKFSKGSFYIFFLKPALKIPRYLFRTLSFQNTHENFEEKKKESGIRGQLALTGIAEQ